MKRILSLLAILALCVGVSYSQVIQEHGVTFNQAREFYKEASVTASTANDTTGYIWFTPATEIAFIGTCDDSVDVNIYYQLKNSTTGAAGSWTLIDSTILTATGATRHTPIAVATFAGYDLIRFYFDFQAATTDGGDGTAATYRCYYFLHRP